MTLVGDAAVSPNQTDFFSFSVTGTASLTVANTRDDVQITYEDLNFLYRNMDSVTFTVDTTANVTYKFEVCRKLAKNLQKC